MSTQVISVRLDFQSSLELSRYLAGDFDAVNIVFDFSKITKV
jgi:hypothetical protein